MPKKIRLDTPLPYASWSCDLGAHLDELRQDLNRHRDAWPQITELTGIPFSTILGIARNWHQVYTLGVDTWTLLANALEKLTRETTDAL